MTSIKELIAKHCPDRVVQHKTLGEFCSISTGKGITNKDLVEKGLYPVISGGVEPMGLYNSYNRNENTVTIARAGTAGYVNFLNTKFYLNDKCFSVIPNDDTNSKFLYYALKNQEDKIIGLKSIGTVPTVNTTKIASIVIPLPPLAVQQEIVKILDRFSSATTELIKNLTAELKLRKKQYEYYRDQLLTFGSDVPRVRLEEVCSDFIVPMRDKPKVFDGSIPWCRIEDLEGHYFNTSKSGRFVSEDTVNQMNLKIFPIGTVICSCSASLGTYALNTKPLITNQTFIGLVCGEKLINKFLRYYMETQTEKLIQLSNTGTIPYISRKKFEELVIPLPPISVQQQIVSVLDKFDTYCNDLTQGLPKEIELRKKQYEYYRDLLLTFRPFVDV